MTYEQATIARCTRDGHIQWQQVAIQLGRPVESVRAAYDTRPPPCLEAVERHIPKAPRPPESGKRDRRLALSGRVTGDIWPMPPRARAIALSVAAHHGITQSELIGSGLAPRYSRPRHEAMWLMKQTDAYSLTQIGAFFGRDHTTAINGIRQHAKRLSEQQEAA